MTEIIIGGETFNIVVEGAAHAPAVVLAHSLGTNMHVFRKQVLALTPHFRVIRYDLRGHGGSVVSHGPYSIGQLGHDALAMLDALNLEKVHWVGLATGGLVAQWLLQHAPERLDRVVLANTAAKAGGADIWNERIRTVHERGLEALTPTLVENWFTRDYRERHPEEVSHVAAELRGTSPEGYAAAAAAVRDADFRENLRSIKHPVLVIVGRHDPVAPPGLGALIASTVEGAKLVTLESAQLSPIEAAEAFNHAVVEFLTGEVGKPAEPVHEPIRAPAAEAPKKPRKPRVPRPKPEPVAAPERPHAAEPEPVPAPPAPKPRPAPKPAAKPTPEPPAAHAPARKRPAKKSAAKKAAAKKAARKAAAKKRPARKATTKKSAVKKAAAKKRVARKPSKKTRRKTVTKRTSVRKATAKKRPAKRSSAKKSTRKTVRRRRR